MVDWLSEVDLGPDHAPEAKQEVASVEDQVSMEGPPLVTDVGFAASETVGTGGGVVPGMVTVGGVASPPLPQAVNARASTGMSSSVFMCHIGILIAWSAQRRDSEEIGGQTRFSG